MRRLAIFLILLGSLVSRPAQAGRVVDVRVGAHAEKTRIVIELDEPSGYRIGQQEIPTATGIVTELVVQMEATGAFALAGRRGLVESVRIKPQGEGAVALIRLTTQTPTINDMALENPHRIVIDVARGGTAAPPPDTRPPAPVVEPEFTEPPPDVIVGTAPRATQLGGPPSSITAKPVPVPAEQPAAPGPAVPATPPPPAPTPAAAAPAPGPAAPAAPAPSPAPTPVGEPGAGPTPPSAGEPTGPHTATAPEAPPAAEPPAAAQPPAPVLPPRPSLERPGTAPAIEPGGRAATLPQLIEMLRTDPRVIGSAALVAALFVLWLVLRRRSSAARRRRVEPFPPLPPLDGLAPTVDERDLVGPVREEPAPSAADPIEDELPAPKRAARTSWRDPLPGTRAAPPVAAPAAAPAARFEPPPPAWNEMPPPPEPDQAELWDESDLEPEAPIEEEPALPEPPSDLPPAPAPAASLEMERELRELERRLRHLETRLEEATESRERMERQLAANAEELRVQRSAIARTQRVVRSLSQPDPGTKEPLRGPGS